MGSLHTSTCWLYHLVKKHKNHYNQWLKSNANSGCSRSCIFHITYSSILIAITQPIILIFARSLLLYIWYGTPNSVYILSNLIYIFVQYVNVQSSYHFRITNYFMQILIQFTLAKLKKWNKLQYFFIWLITIGKLYFVCSIVQYVVCMYVLVSTVCTSMYCTFTLYIRVSMQ